MLVWFGKLVYCCTELEATLPSICPPNVQPHDKFYQAFLSISTASGKHWGEKAWVQGYNSQTIYEKKPKVHSLETGISPMKPSH